MQGVSAKFSPEEIDNMIRAADADGNGSISEAEFIAVMRTKKKSVNTLLLREK